jgi:hypothetical protein
VLMWANEPAAVASARETRQTQRTNFIRRGYLQLGWGRTGNA